MTDLASVFTDARELVERCRTDGLRLAVAESCTGGLVAAAITEVPGSSAVFDRGFVTYSNQAKTGMLGVPEELIAAHGAVSAEVAAAMAAGALARSAADISVAVTGIAGPDGGSAEKPVGLVHFAAARKGHPARSAVHAFEDLGRDSIRLAAVRQALRLMTQMASGG